MIWDCLHSNRRKSPHALPFTGRTCISKARYHSPNLLYSFHFPDGSLDTEAMEPRLKLLEALE